MCPRHDDPALRLWLRAEPLAVRAALGQVRAMLMQGGGGVDPDIAELVLAEVLNNIVEHGYEGSGGRIGVELHEDAAGLVCAITDDGSGFPEMALPSGGHPSAGSPAPVRAPPEGGYGWFLIRGLTEGLCYSRAGGRNRLTFRIPAEQSAGAGAIVSPWREAPQ